VKANLKSHAGSVIIGCVIALAGGNVFGMGGDHPNDRPVAEPSWPKGMADLVNTTNRIGGLWVNAEDIFFYSGTATNFSAFLAAYAAVEPVDQHRLVLLEGAGEAYSLGGGNRRPCDWELFGCPKSWLVGHAAMAEGTNAIAAREQAARDTNYVLEVHFWTGGKIPVDQLTIPQNVELAGECFKIFESITNGMTRGEVEKKLMMDGGLQTVSPVRFLDPACPGFKINVEFDFNRNAIEQNRAIETKADKVIRVSKPYLERPSMD
jgi:hypothetical protein